MAPVHHIIDCIKKLELEVEPGLIKELGQLLPEAEKEIQPQSPAGSLFKMIQSVYKYLASREVMAHPETIPTLSALASDLALLLTDPLPSDQEVQTIVSGHIASFKALKAKAGQTPIVSEEEMEELKAVILSVDWEISEATLTSFDQVLSQLKQRFKTTQKIHFAFLSIMHSLGVYIARNKADAHTDALNLLWSVFQDYEHLAAHPELDPEEKKGMIKANLASYNEFKQRVARPEPVQPVIARPAAPDIQEQKDPAHTDPEDSDPSGQQGSEIIPALAHVDAEASDREMMPLNTLPDPLAVPPVQPMPSLEKTPEPPGDVMGDLLSATESDSPADKLLEEIHLAELHGPDQENTGQIRGNADGSSEEGITSFTPQKMDKEPIPEIQSRLDGFFNLDWSPDTDAPQTPVAPPPETEPVTDPESALVQMDSEPEGEPIPDDGILLVSEGDDDPEFTALTSGSLTDPVLDRLNQTLAAPETLVNESVYTQVTDDLYLLKALGQGDKEKAGLIELITSLTQYIHESDFTDTDAPGPDLSKDPDDQEDQPQENQDYETPDDENQDQAGQDRETQDLEEIEKPDLDQEEEKESKGFWAKFTSSIRK